MLIHYIIKPKSHIEYCDTVDAISDFLDRNNIEHKKYELPNKTGKIDKWEYDVMSNQTDKGGENEIK